MIEYDTIAQDYSKNQEDSIQKKYLFDNSFMNSLGDLNEKNVLDLACGNGYFTRMIKLAGAKEVVGIDISKEMIELARREEKREQLGIKYFAKDVIKLGHLGEFDIVSAGFLFHYSSSKEELSNMCKTVYENLKQKGRLVSIGPNPVYPLTNHKKYGFTLEGKEPVREGDILITRLFSGGNERCSFNYYHWTKETYEKALRNAGFKDIKWIPIEVSKEGIKKYGKEFWKDFLNNPPIIIIIARK